MINKISVPKVNLTKPQKQTNAEKVSKAMVQSEEKKEIAEKVFTSPKVHWEPVLTTAPIFIGVTNMQEALEAYKKMQELL